MRIASFIILFLLQFGLKAQEINKEIEKDFRDYFALISEKKIDSALNYTNPKMFEFVPRVQMKTLLESVYKMPNIEYKTGVSKFKTFDTLKKIDNINYVRFEIVSPIEMKFTDVKPTTEKVKEMVRIFEVKFGTGNVVFDSKTGFYKINAQKIIIASSEDTLINWKFVTINNPNSKLLLTKFIPEELLK